MTESKENITERPWLGWGKVEGRTYFSVGAIRFDVRVTVIVVISTLLCFFDLYGFHPTNSLHKLGVHISDAGLRIAYDRFAYYFVIPMLIILVLFWDKPSDYGFTFGRWKEGLAWTAIGCSAMAIIIGILVVKNPTMQHYYYVTRGQTGAVTIVHQSAVEMFAWEFIWRGFYLFGLARVVGPGPAILLQTVPFAFMHAGKPDLIEVMSTPFGGACFGFVAWRTRSFVYPFIIHAFQLVFLILLSIALAAP